MTDLEMTVLCAESMGYKVVSLDPTKCGPVQLDVAIYTGTIIVRKPHVINDRAYYPLHDDAQAMELVKKFRITIMAAPMAGWIIHGGGEEAFTKVANTDLNRAIVECVAKMQKAVP